jgi:uncharacterized protein YndB with AHSA1/START domain
MENEMTVINVQKDLDAMTMKITTKFEAPAERIWRLWSDPRQLERWWGPPTYPASVTEHDISPGGAVAYFMTGPEGDTHHGWWRVEEADPPNLLRFEDGFANADGEPNDAMPTTIATVTLTESNGRTTMEIESRFPSQEGMEKMLEMGTEEGMTLALGQIDDLLAEDAAEAA